MGAILQSGLVTPGHLASWVTDGIVQDAGVSFSNSFGLLAYTKAGINFNAGSTDYPLLINLPNGYTRYRVDRILVSNASHTLSTATCGVFTDVGAGGTAVVTSGTSLTVTATTTDTNNNMQSFTINNQNSLAWSDTVLYFRVQNVQGAAATADVTIFYEPLP